jgi:hypothetical protein
METIEHQHPTEEQIRASALWAKSSLSTEEEKTFQMLSYNRSLELTPEEEHAVIEIAVKVAISEAKEAKANREYARLYAKMTMSDPVYPEITAKDFFSIIVKLGTARFRERKMEGFVVDKNNEKIIKILSMYFSGDRRVVEYGYSLDKGILLIGGVGCGKTQLMSLCRTNPNTSYTQHDCTDISTEYQQEGPSVIDYYTENTKNTKPEHAFGQEFFGRFFDDLGAESNAKNFGTERNVMAEIIQRRDKLHPHYLTHFTSNLTMDELEQSYGIRTADRLRGMCNVIEFPSSARSRRK